MDVAQQRAATMKAISTATWALMGASLDIGRDDVGRLAPVARSLTDIGAELLTVGRDLSIALSGWESASE